MTIDTGSSLVMGDADTNKISYHLPAMGGLTVGISQADGGKAQHQVTQFHMVLTTH